MEAADRELLDALTVTRQALKGLQRQARQTLQLATALQDRLAARELIIANRIAEERGPANDQHHTETTPEPQAGTEQFARAV